MIRQFELAVQREHDLKQRDKHGGGNDSKACVGKNTTKNKI